MMRKVLVLLLLIISLPLANAEELHKKISATGSSVEVSIPAGYTEKKFVIWSSVSGNLSQIGAFSFTLPSGAIVKSYSIKQKGDGAAQLKSLSGWTPISFLDSKGNELTAVAAGSTGASSTPTVNIPTENTGNKYCGNLSAEELDLAIQDYLRFTGVKFTRDQLCAELKAQGAIQQAFVTPSTANETFAPLAGTAGVALIRKDTCSLKSNDKTLVRFDISLDKVDPAILQAGFSSSASFLTVKHSGPKAATLKPTSDGKFAPRPLFLMSSTGWGYYGGESATLVKWGSKGKISKKSLRIEDYVTYRSYSLARMVAAGHLSGGKGVLEIRGGSATMYSVCFKLSKSRQRYNGYTN